MPQRQLSYCGEQVRRHDRERFRTCLFAPPDRREALFALYAFNHEVAKTREVVSEVMLGEIRLQWWRDSIAGIYEEKPRDHAVVGPLADTIGRYRLGRARFDGLIDARGFDLEGRAPSTVEELERYAAGTSGQLVQLALEALGCDGAEALEAGDLIGRAWSLCGVLRTVPFHAERGRLLLPEDLQADCGIEPQDLLAQRSSAALSEAVRRLAGMARRHLSRARELRREVPRHGRSALLLGTLADGHLARLAKAGYDPFRVDQTRAAAQGIWRMAFASVLGRY